MTRDEYIMEQRTKYAATCTEEIHNISCHIKMLIDLEWQKEIGATEDRDLHIRVMRIMCDYNRLREDAANHSKALDLARHAAHQARIDLIEIKRQHAQEAAEWGPG